MIEKLGGRKIFLGMLVVAIGVVVDSVAKNGLSTNLLELLKFIGVGFFLGNGVEHMAIAIKDKKAPEMEATDLSPVSVRLDSMSNSLNSLMEKTNSIVDANSTTQKGISYIITAAGLDQTTSQIHKVK